MSDSTNSEPAAEGLSHSPQRWPLWKKALLLLVGIVGTYVVVAYLLMPLFWREYLHHHPSLEGIPSVTHTGTGIPGDPLNVALIGSKHEVIKIMVAAEWFPADPLTLKSSVEIVAATMLRHPYKEAPVSNLFLFGRKEDLAFEQPVGHDPRQRHHVRFWMSEKEADDGRPIWVGSVTYDKGVELSRTTGQVTHHIAPDLDAERDRLIEELDKTGNLSETYVMDAFHEKHEGHNGGGDLWRTDGNLHVGIIVKSE